MVVILFNIDSQNLSVKQHFPYFDCAPRKQSLLSGGSLDCLLMEVFHIRILKAQRSRTQSGNYGCQNVENRQFIILLVSSNTGHMLAVV